MKLKNKRTGEIGEYIPGTGLAFIVRVYAVRSGDTPFVDYQHNSLAELYNEWEDYGPKEYWYIYAGKPHRADCGDILEEDFRAIGNHFETREETEKAIEKLKVLTRLQNNGFKFVELRAPNWNARTDVITIKAECNWNSNNIDDLRLLFGGEE